MLIFFFTDIEGSTRLWEHSRAAMTDALARHDGIIRDEVAQHGGRVVKHTGDGAFAVFPEGSAPLACALAIQRRVAATDWGTILLKVRIAIHAGDADEREGDYYGPDVNRAARLLPAGWGGQILLTEEASRLPRPPGAGLTDLGVYLFRDLSVPTRVFQLNPDAGNPLAFPPLRNVSHRPHNLPPQPTPFIGREEEIAAATSLILKDGCRWLTLVGPGGVGKTRLGWEVAAGCLDNFPWGVWFVELAPLEDARYVPAAVATALRLSLSERASPLEQIRDFLSDKDLLLVLDNFEHVKDAAVAIAGVLDAGPTVKVLATSRERLKVSYEHVLTVTGFKIPEDAAPADSFGAGRLFLAAARRADASFHYRDGDALIIREILRLVEGMPLAIELAASWTTVLSPAEIRDELTRGLTRLERGPLNGPARHRSLRAVYDYSLSLCSPPQRHAVAQLAVFRGGFTREAARDVAGVGILELSALIDKSLVRKAGDGRFDMHEAISQFAREDLADETRDRHAAYYLGVLREGIEAAETDNGAQALGALHDELDNIRTAWARAIETKQEDLLLQAAEPLCDLFDFLGYAEEGVAAFQRAVAAVPENGAAYHWLIANLSRQYIRTDDFPSGAPLATRAISYHRKNHNWRGVILGLQTLATIAFYGRRLDRAQRISERLVKIAEKEGLDVFAGRVYLNLSTLAHRGGRLDEALVLAERGLAIADKTGSARLRARAYTNMAAVFMRLERWEDARECAHRGEKAARGAGDVKLRSGLLHNLGVIAARLGDVETALSLVQEAYDLKSSINDRTWLYVSSVELSSLYASLGRWQESLHYAEDGVARARKYAPPHMLIEGYIWLLKAQVALGINPQAEDELVDLVNSLEGKCPPDAASDILSVRAQVAKARGLTKQAIAFAAAAAAVNPDPQKEIFSKELEELRAETDEATYEAAVAEGKKEWQRLLTKKEL